MREAPTRQRARENSWLGAGLPPCVAVRHLGTLRARAAQSKYSQPVSVIEASPVHSSSESCTH
jgi:hypothetical protein